MSRYDHLTNKLKNRQPLYLPYVLLGFPNVETTYQVCQTLVEEGVSGFELGLPFRDPAADGPTIEQAGNEALDNSFTIAKGLELVKRIRILDDKIPLTLMSYYNMVVARGADAFFGDFAKAGVDGILIPDLPPERAEEVAPFAKKHNVKMVFIASPLSDVGRLKLMGQYAGGFVYVVTRLGITGVDARYSDHLQALFKRIHENLPLPAIAGFGISEPDHAQAMVAAGADGVITGSRLIELIREGISNKTGTEPVRKHTQAMIQKLHQLKTTAEPA